tara:strand:+ start:176 stop:382 length:207 start_codon:yes stop_codon:yes gene_type:complete
LIRNSNKGGIKEVEMINLENTSNKPTLDLRKCHIERFLNPDDFSLNLVTDGLIVKLTFEQWAELKDKG